MSLSQFNKWMRRNGVTKGPRGFRMPCIGTAAPASRDDADGERLLVTISTNTRDRHGDILEPGGARIASFLKNPVVLWAHDYRALPIGRVTALTREGNALKAEILFAGTPFAQEACRLYSEKFLNAWSVGFLPLEWEVIEDAEGRFAGYHVRSWELVELSAVPVPANPDALTDAVAKGLVTQPDLMKSLEAAVLAEAAEHAQTAEAPLREDEGTGQPMTHTPEVSPSPAALAALLAPKLLVRLRPCLGDSVAREIRRRQGRLN